jgi:hypothetical protein
VRGFDRLLRRTTDEAILLEEGAALLVALVATDDWLPDSHALRDAARSVMQNGVTPRYRATTGALLLFTLNLVGLGCGPLFVGMVSDALKPAFGNDSLRHALQWLAPFFLLASLCQFATARALHRAAPVSR